MVAVAMNKEGLSRRKFAPLTFTLAFGMIASAGGANSVALSPSLREKGRTLQETETMDAQIAEAQTLSHEQEDAQVLWQKYFGLAHMQSFGFFDDIPNTMWELMRQRVKEMPNHQNPENPLLNADKPEMWYQMNWEPNFSCPNERRIGGMGDGPKWVCNPHRIPQISNQRVATGGEKCLVYSVGSNGNFLFEVALQEAVGVETCEIHIFDPVDFEGVMPPNMFFHAWGIEADDNESNPSNFKSLKETAQILGHEGRVLDIFKIDCEGCEWRTYQDWFNSGLRMHQILVETHYAPDNANDFFETIQRAGFVAFHKEPNTWSAGGTCQEYAFLRLDSSFFE